MSGLPIQDFAVTGELVAYFATSLMKPFPINDYLTPEFFDSLEPEVRFDVMRVIGIDLGDT